MKKLNTEEITIVKLTKPMIKNKVDTFKTLSYIEENNKPLYNRLMEIIPEEVLLLLNYDIVYNYLVSDYMTYNKDRVKSINDFRSPEQVKYNHLLGFVWECILQVILELKGFKVDRTGCDTNILNAKYIINNVPDFKAISSNNIKLMIDSQKADFSNGNNKFRIKESKLKGLLKNGQIVITWIGSGDNNAIKYTSLVFRNINDVYNKNFKYIKNGIGGKPTYEFTVDEEYIRII